jgi:Leucine-rich repeat (LRR) protein
MNSTFIIGKAILLAILITILLTSCSSNDTDSNDNQYLDIPDASFEAILIKEGIDSDGILNQRMLRKDASQVSVLDLNFSSEAVISDLTGIEGFVGLNKLSAMQQEITSIDLTHNTLLDTLVLAGNYISSIDISNNPNLVLLDVQSNQLSAINGLSKAAHLKELNLSFNELEEFSIENETLEILKISNNLLHSFDVKGSINLKNILLTTNELTSVDFSKNILLETLLISDNNIQNIDLEHNTSLTHLYISSNSLTDLDVGNNQELIDLKVDRNPNLSCIKIQGAHNIPNVSISEYQELNTSCE